MKGPIEAQNFGIGMVKWAYNSLIRPITPHKLSVHNNVVVPKIVRLFDATDRFPRYKEENVSELRQHVHPGDYVTIIGAGRGVTSVWAARCAGPSGRVTAFEADTERAQLARETVTLNGVRERCSIREAVVASAIKTAGTSNADELIPPTELQDCDVIEIDCEGAELAILKELLIRPRTIIVETHPQFGSPTGAVTHQLEQMGYVLGAKFVDPADGHILTAHWNE